MSNRFVLILLALIVGFAGIFWFSKNSKKDATSTSAAQASNHITGEGKKGVTVVEYGDYQCPACYQYEPIIEAVRDKYKADIYFQFRNFPITSKHPNAMVSARAAEAAAKQNKFWEMHDLLYKEQQSWSSSSTPTTFFEQYAQQLSLDVAKFKQDMNSTEVNATINADMADATSKNVEGTPTFFIDGKKITTPNSVEEFGKLIEEAIKNKNQ